MDSAVGDGRKTVFIDATKAIFTQQESSQIALNTRLKPLLKNAIDKCYAKLMEDGKTSMAESLVKYHHPDELLQDVPAEKNLTKKPKDKTKDKDDGKHGSKNINKDVEKTSVKRSRSKSIPELAELQISVEIPDAFSSDEEDFLAENGDLETEDASSRNSVSFLLHIKYQRTLAGSISMADDPNDLWPVQLNAFPVLEDQTFEAEEDME